MSVAAIGGAVIGGVISSRASSRAAGAQRDAANQASSLSERQFDLTRADQQPFQQTGYRALNELTNLLGGPRQRLPATAETFDGAAYLAANPDVAANAMYGNNPWGHYQDWGVGEGREAKYKGNAGNVAGPDADTGSLLRKFSAQDFEEDPGYAFRQAEGMRGLTNSTAARGGLLSGAALKAASRYNQDFASNEYGNAYNRFNTDQGNKFNRLASLAGIGQSATNQVANQSANMVQNVGNNMIGAGNARASGYVGGANAVNSAIGQGFNSYQQNRLVNSYLS